MEINKDGERCIDLDNIDLTSIEKKSKKPEEAKVESQSKIGLFSIFTILNKLIDSQFSKITDIKKVDKRTEQIELTLRSMHTAPSLSKDVNDER